MPPHVMTMIRTIKFRFERNATMPYHDSTKQHTGWLSFAHTQATVLNQYVIWMLKSSFRSITEMKFSLKQRFSFKLSFNPTSLHQGSQPHTSLHANKISVNTISCLVWTYFSVNSNSILQILSLCTPLHSEYSGHPPYKISRFVMTLYMMSGET